MRDIHFPPDWSPLKRLSFAVWIEEELAREAQAIEAQRAATVKQGAVADEGAVAASDAPKP